MELTQFETTVETKAQYKKNLGNPTTRKHRMKKIEPSEWIPSNDAYFNYRLNMTKVKDKSNTD